MPEYQGIVIFEERYLQALPNGNCENDFFRTWNCPFKWRASTAFSFTRINRYDTSQRNSSLERKVGVYGSVAFLLSAGHITLVFRSI